MKKIIILILALILISGCDKYNEAFPTAKPADTTNLTPINGTPINSTNETIEIPIEIFEDKLAIYFPNIKGNSIIIKEEETLLIDGGFEEDSKQILTDLRNLEIEQLDYLIISNINKKRIGGLPYIILRTDPIKTYESGLSSEDTELYRTLYNRTKLVQADSIINFGGGFLSFIVPYDDQQGFGNSHDTNSIIIKLIYEDFRILFMSDCDYECEERISGSELNANVLVVSENCNSTSLLFLRKVNPEKVIVLKECKDINTRLNNLNLDISNGGVITTDGMTYSIK